MRIEHKVDQIAKRKKAYPSIEEQLDAIWKGGDEMESMKQHIQSIKDKYPKKEKGIDTL